MKVQFDAGLVARYDRPGPRYTSYPTAVQLLPSIAEAAYGATVASTNAGGGLLSLYVHVPFCTNPCFYCGCTRVITRNPAAGANYLQHLNEEIRLRGAQVDRSRVVDQLHFGGGSPTFLTPPQLAATIAKVGEHFQLNTGAGREFAIEVDPRTVSAADIQALADMGFNRISLGVQDIDAGVQAAVNRVQPLEQVRAVIEAAHHARFESISVDLIYGLPRQNPETFARTLDAVADLRPDRVAVYGYAHLPQLFKAQQQIDERQLPDGALRLKLLGLAVERLVTAGYEYLGLDHFALPDDELVRAQREGTLVRNFQGYSTHGGLDLLGMGMSAISQVGDTYVQNLKTLEGYYAAIEAGHLPVERGVCLTRDDLIRRHVIQRLMCDTVMSFTEVEARFGLDFTDYFASELLDLEPLVQDGLVVREAHGLRITPVGRPLMRNVAMVFDAYLQAPSVEGRAQHSRTV